MSSIKFSKIIVIVIIIRRRRRRKQTLSIKNKLFLSPIHHFSFFSFSPSLIGTYRCFQIFCDLWKNMMKTFIFIFDSSVSSLFFIYFIILYYLGLISFNLYPDHLIQVYIVYGIGSFFLSLFSYTTKFL